MSYFETREKILLKTWGQKINFGKELRNTDRKIK